MPQLPHDKRRDALRPAIDKRVADYADATAAAAAASAFDQARTHLDTLSKTIDTLTATNADLLQRIAVLEKSMQVLLDKEVERQRRPVPLMSRAEMVNRARLAGWDAHYTQSDSAHNDSTQGDTE